MSTKKPVILIADDDPEILTMLGIRLSKKGYQVLEAVDGNQTLNLARKHKPDLVLLDVMMPGKNGWEVAKELRADDDFASVGIVMLTAIGEKVNEMTSPLYGADAYVDKPFEFEELDEKVKEALEARASQRDAVARPVPRGRKQDNNGVGGPARAAKAKGSGSAKGATKSKSKTKPKSKTQPAARSTTQHAAPKRKGTNMAAKKTAKKKTAKKTAKKKTAKKK